MPARMPEIISESKKAWQNICQQVCQIDCRNLYIYKYCIYVCHNYFQMVCQKLCQPGVSRWGSLEETSFCMTFENQFLKIIFGARLTNQRTRAEFSEYSENIFKLDCAWSSHAATCWTKLWRYPKFDRDQLGSALASSSVETRSYVLKNQFIETIS